MPNILLCIGMTQPRHAISITEGKISTTRLITKHQGLESRLTSVENRHVIKDLLI